MHETLGVHVNVAVAREQVDRVGTRLGYKVYETTVRTTEVRCQHPPSLLLTYANRFFHCERTASTQEGHRLLLKRKCQGL